MMSQSNTVKGVSPFAKASGENRRVSYSGYYECFPSIRGGFDSRYPLHPSSLADASFGGPVASLAQR